MNTMTKRNNENKIRAALYGLATTAISFMLFFISIKFILGSTLLLSNIIGLLGFSVLIGLISFTLFLLRLKIAFTIFSAGLISGFALMINTFRGDIVGWGDLIGLLTFIMLTLMGLIVGLIVQLVVYLIKKSKNRNTD